LAVRPADQVTTDAGPGRDRASGVLRRHMPPSNYRLTKIPEMTIRRLSIYTRCLLQLEEDDVKTISSQELAERFNLNSAQVRKDLAYFGEFGVRGIGYYVSGLKAELQRILGLDREWAVALVGFGNLGSALFHYKGFTRQGFRIAAIFDEDPAKVARAVAGGREARGGEGVTETTRHASAAPGRLGSIRARLARRRSPGTGPCDPFPSPCLPAPVYAITRAPATSTKRFDSWEVARVGA